RPPRSHNRPGCQNTAEGAGGRSGEPFPRKVSAELHELPGGPGVVPERSKQGLVRHALIAIGDLRDAVRGAIRSPSTTAPVEATQDKLLDKEGHLTVLLITIVVAAEERASVTANDLQALLPSLEMFHRRFGRFFVRSEARAWSHKYLIGLTLPIERKN